jgi:hypothetical protein
METELFIDDNNAASTFIVTKLKDSYDGILGMPWMRRHGDRVDWQDLKIIPTEIATTAVVPLVPPKPSGRGEEPRRHSRMTNVELRDAHARTRCQDSIPEASLAYLIRSDVARQFLFPISTFGFNQLAHLYSIIRVSHIYRILQVGVIGQASRR